MQIALNNGKMKLVIFMEYYVFRLKRGDDLKKSIVEFCNTNNIEAGCIVTVVGSIYELRIRKADGASEYFETRDFEIVSLCGTISRDGAHLHIAVSDKRLVTLGGHLLEGTMVNTTAEIVLMKFDKYEMTRKFDQNTGYKELEVKEIER